MTDFEIMVREDKKLRNPIEIIKDINPSTEDLQTVLHLYDKHHHGNCFDILFSMSFDKGTYKVHRAVDVNGYFQFEAHDTSWNLLELSLERKTNKIQKFVRYNSL